MSKVTEAGVGRDCEHRAQGCRVCILSHRLFSLSEEDGHLGTPFQESKGTFHKETGYWV